MAFTCEYTTQCVKHALPRASALGLVPTLERNNTRAVRLCVPKNTHTVCVLKVIFSTHTACIGKSANKYKYCEKSTLGAYVHKCAYVRAFRSARALALVPTQEGKPSAYAHNPRKAAHDRAMHA